MVEANHATRRAESVPGSVPVYVFSTEAEEARATDGTAAAAVKTAVVQMKSNEGMKMATETQETQQSAVDYLEHAVDDLNQARQEAQEDVRSAIDSAISRAREALDDVRSETSDRAEKLRARAEERTHEWQRALEDASEDVRRELGVRAVRAQRSKEAIEAIEDEIKTQKKELQ